MIKVIKLYALLLTLAVSIFSIDVNAKSSGKNALTAYYGLGTNAHIEEIPTFSFEKRSAYLAGLGYNHSFYDTEKFLGLSIEYELGFYDHFGDFGSYQEGTIAAIFRFNDLFPKNFFIESFAIGEGLSLASSDPQFESHLHYGNRSNDLLNYLAFELVFKLPKLDDTKFIYRLHHRSGVYGLFDGISGGSNYLSFGLRQKF